MAILEKNIIDVIEILENNTIQIRNANIIEKDGVEIARTYHRHSLSPGDDVSNEDARVQAIANAIWTDEVVNAYKELIAKADRNTTQ
jgi:predicted regulator of Ras-like GTPase activity (Roadblock/LC7/MglB family)